MSDLIIDSPLAEPQESEVAEDGVMIDHGTMTDTSECDPVASTVSTAARTAAEATVRINRTRQFAKQYIEECGFSLCPIAKGSKGPKSKGWQNNPLAQTMIGDHGLGLIHTLSGTCAIDLDDLQAAEAYLGAQGIELRELLADDDAVQIISGRPNRSKLLYRLPEGMVSPITKQIKRNGTMIIEFRCAPSDGDGCQDVLPPTIHPKTGAEYKWGGAGDFTKLPVLPASLLKIWREERTSNALRVERDDAARDANGALHMIVEGSRNDTFFKRAGDLFGMGLPYESVLAAVMAENQVKCSEPLSSSEVETLVRSARNNSDGGKEASEKHALDAAVCAAADAATKRETEQVSLVDFVDQLPPVLKEIGAWYEHRAVMPQPVLKLPIALAACGGVLARDFTGAGGAFTNLYCVVVGPPGSGKEAALRCVNDIVETYDAGRRSGPPASDGGLLAALTRAPSSTFVIDELGDVLKGIFDPKAANYKAAIGTVFLEMYTKGGTRYFGREYSKQTGHEGRARVDIYSPCPSIFGATTPSTFYAAMSSNAINSGFMPRLLTFRVPDKIPYAKVATNSPMPALVHDWLEKIAERVECHNKSINRAGADLAGIQGCREIQVPYAAEAAELFTIEQMKVVDQRNAGAGELDSNMLSRKVENASRLALILALAEDPHAVEVRAQHLRLALDIVGQAADAFMAEIRGNLFDSRYAALESKVLDYIKQYFQKKKTAVTEGVMADKCPLYKNASLSDRRNVIEALKRRGMIVVTDGRKNGSLRYTPTAAAFQQ
ncbi:MAG: DUF3987 domain-containing protein [Oxalobacteraceae bacterium]|nr:MAG: DUF3987 domain-containing protein [Oxalobacteraceae bacterium]